MEKIITNDYNLKEEDMTELVVRVKILLINSNNGKCFLAIENNKAIGLIMGCIFPMMNMTI